MRTSTDRITWRNGFRLNGEPAYQGDIQGIFDDRVNAKKWEIYEQRKAEILDRNLSASEYELACRQLADELGI